MTVIRYINNSEQALVVDDIEIAALDQIISKVFIPKLDKLAGKELLVLVDGTELTEDMVPGYSADIVDTVVDSVKDADNSSEVTTELKAEPAIKTVTANK